MRNEKTVARRSLSEKVHEKSNSRQNRGGAGYILLPDGVEIFKPKKEANFRFNIVPYVAGANNLATEEGELDYEFTFWVHSIDNGDSRMAIVCPKKTYGKKCPICEMVERLSKDYAENEDEIKKFKAKQRQLFNVVDARDEEQKIQIYETSYYKAFGEMLDKRLRTQDDEDEDYSNFADIPGGRTLKVAYVEETFNNNKFYAPSSIDFIDRKEELQDDIVDHAVVLDSCLKVLSYDEIMKLLADDDIEEDKLPRKPSKATPNVKQEKDKPVKEEVKKGKRNEEENEDNDEDEDKEENPQRKPAKDEVKNRRKRDEEDEEEDEEEKPKRRPVKEEVKASSKRDENEEEEDEEDEKPKRRPSKEEVKKGKRDEEEAEDEEEEDEKPKSKSKSESKPKGKCGKCPHGFSFGADCYIHEECDTCECVEECDAAQ